MLKTARYVTPRQRMPAAMHMSAWVLLLLHGVSQAQTAPAPKAEEIKPSLLDNYVPSEEVKRRALGPLRIIKQSGDQKRAPTPTPTPAAAPAPVAASPSPAPARAKAEEASRAERPAPVVEAVVPEPAPVIAAPAPVPVAPPPAPVQAAKPKNLELIPILQEPPSVNYKILKEAQRGVVKVAFDVNPDGSTGDIQVLQTSNRKLNPSAIEAVQKWKFKPIDETVRVDIDLLYSAD